jgi:flagellar hook-associated protein 3 FlgL
MSPSAKNDIATQLQSIRDALLGQANTTYLGRSIFAGSSDAPQAFSSAGYAFNGAPGSSVNRRVGDGQSVRVDVDGSAVYGNGASSMFSDLDTIINDLRTGGNVSADISLVDARMQAVSTAQAQVGTQLSTVQNAQSANANRLTLLQGKKSDLEDVDTGQSILNLTMMNNVYSASLLVTSKSMSTSLMDFLR